MTLSLSHAHGPLTPAVEDRTLGALLSDAANTVPGRTALIEGTKDAARRRQWTYRQLHTDAVRTAQALLSRFEPGDHIAVWSHNTPEWLMLEFGCAMAGMVLVTVNPAYQSAELEYVLKQSRSVALFVVDEHRGNPMLSIASTVTAQCEELRCIVRFAEWQDFIDSGSGFNGKLPAVCATDPVMMQYTSGTTGFPKGALLHHRGLANNGHHFARRMGVKPGDVYITYMPLFHTAGSVMSVLGCVSLRCTQVLVDAFEPGLVLELCETFAVNSMLAVPTMLISMLEHDDFSRRDLSTVSAVCSGGSVVPDHLVRTFERELGAPFTIIYGQTECSPCITMNDVDDVIDDKAGTIGTAMPCTELKIVDPQSRDTLPIGAIGELCTRGYHVMHGYFEMPEQTAQTIDADGWLLTGDLAAMDGRGYCTIEGRLKDMIIRGGENIYPRELEDLLFSHASVGEVAVVGLPDDRWGETVGAFIRPAAGQELSRAELFDYLRAHLAPHKTPKQWYVVPEFPMTGSGKIQKFRLREMWQCGDVTEMN